MDSTARRTMLLDFYGDLLTEKQREYFDLHYNSDLSLYEIAEQSGVSRQAVWDIIRRAEQSLNEFEAKTGLVARASRRREMVEKLRAAAHRLPDCDEKCIILDGLDELCD